MIAIEPNGEEIFVEIQGYKVIVTLDENYEMTFEYQKAGMTTTINVIGDQRSLKSKIANIASDESMPPHLAIALNNLADLLENKIYEIDGNMPNNGVSGLTIPNLPVNSETSQFEYSSSWSTYLFVEGAKSTLGENFKVNNPNRRNHLIGVRANDLSSQPTRYFNLSRGILQFAQGPTFATLGLGTIVHEIAAHVTGTLNGVSLENQHEEWYGNGSGSPDEVKPGSPEDMLRSQIIKNNEN